MATRKSLTERSKSKEEGFTLYDTKDEIGQNPLFFDNMDELQKMLDDNPSYSEHLDDFIIIEGNHSIFKIFRTGYSLEEI